MSREIKQDYEKLISYFADYNLSDVISNPNFLNNMKCIHKKLYTYQIFICEAEAHKLFPSASILEYYAEVGSDLILSLFCWANGAYKPAEFQLRSAIENFLKASLQSIKDDIILCKNVSDIMDFASTSTFFNNPICKSDFEILRNKYSILCAFVHSSPEKLISEKALIQLPKYNEPLAKEFTQNFLAILNCFLCFIYYNYYEFVFSIHNANRNLFLQGLSSSDKEKIYKEKTKNTDF